MLRNQLQGAEAEDLGGYCHTDATLLVLQGDSIIRGGIISGL